ncbi:type II secretion system F family protein [[Clostridium] colinum]|uniref:type II secretion system F family protein n=1 Tax=[Clostridium] colinum TaxID=36835 RepID=UPI002024E17C|nr:type II secretion system F family protein [[Clostridium] colinum]
MPKYTYTAINQDGKKIKGVIEADSIGEFHLILKGRREYLISIKSFKEKNIFENKYKISKKELFVLCRQFSAMLSSGVNLVKCLEILYNQTKNKKVKIALYEVYEKLQIGQSLSEAMQSLNGAFPEFMINMIKAGEISGSLEEAIKRLSIQYEKDLKIQNKILSAMIYPAFLLVASILSVIIMFGIVLPKIMDIVGNTESMNIFSRILFQIAKGFKENWLAILMVSLVSLIIFSIHAQTDKFKKRFAKFKVKAPLIGKLYITMIAGIFTRTLSTLFLSGTTLIDAIHMAGKVINNAYINDILENVINDITNGMTFSDALIKADIFPYNVTAMISVGEETGSLEEVLSQTSDYYDMIAEDAIQKMTSIIEPIMIIIFGVIVLIILAGAFVPIYTMYNNINSI